MALFFCFISSSTLSSSMGSEVQDGCDQDRVRGVRLRVILSDGLPRTPILGLRKEFRVTV